MRNVLEREIRFEKANVLRKAGNPFFFKVDESEFCLGMHAILELHVRAQEESKTFPRGWQNLPETTVSH